MRRQILLMKVTGAHPKCKTISLIYNTGKETDKSRAGDGGRGDLLGLAGIREAVGRYYTIHKESPAEPYLQKAVSAAADSREPLNDEAF